MSAHTRLVCKPLALVAGVALACSAAQAADNTRYIGITGNNANACTLAAPCRTLQRGINMTPAGGELRILDSGFYGNNAIVNKSLTISGNGNTLYLGSTIVVDKAGAVVVLRGLTLDGQGMFTDGIRISAAAAVRIERCLVHDFGGSGIDINLAAGLEVSVIDSVARDNDTNGLLVINAGPSLLTVDNSHFDHNGGSGISIHSGIATIRRSTASGNGGDGIVAINASASVMSTAAVRNGDDGFFASVGSTMTVESSLAHGNGGDGLAVSNGGLARISNSTFIGNDTGIANSVGSTLETRGNNTIRGNTPDVIGARTLIGGL